MQSLRHLSMFGAIIVAMLGDSHVAWLRMGLIFGASGGATPCSFGGEVPQLCPIATAGGSAPMPLPQCSEQSAAHALDRMGA